MLHSTKSANPCRHVWEHYDKRKAHFTEFPWTSVQISIRWYVVLNDVTAKIVCIPVRCQPLPSHINNNTHSEKKGNREGIREREVSETKTWVLKVKKRCFHTKKSCSHKNIPQRDAEMVALWLILRKGTTLFMSTPDCRIWKLINLI